MEIEPAIAQSRLQSQVGNFTDALDILVKARSLDHAEDMDSQFQAEINRISLIRGHHKSLPVFPQNIQPGRDTCTDLMSIQTALSLVSSNLDLTHSLESASSLFKLYKPALEVKQDDEQAPLILYYCLEIHYFWRLYGDGINESEISDNGDFLQKLIFRLIQSRFYHEALQLLECFVEDPQPLLESLASCLVAEANPVLIMCLLSLARIHSQKGGLEDTGQIVEVVRESLEEKLMTAKMYCEMIALRFLEEGSGIAERVSGLIQLSTTLHGLQDYKMSSQALEYAAELMEYLTDIPQATNFGHQIHDSLREVLVASGDVLTHTLIEFRYCDFLNASTNNLASARARRSELLSSPLSSKLPYFHRFYKRQWAEYFMLHQREEALYHAEMYLEYCKRCRDDEEQSLAVNIRLQTILQPYRTSEEKRVDVLEDICSQLRGGIETDRTNSWFSSLAEKQLLLVEALVELGRLQEEDSEDVVVEARGLLREAEAVLDRIDGKANNTFVKYEIAFLNTSVSLYLDERFQEQSTTSFPQHGNNAISGASFSSVFWLQTFLLSLQNDCLQTFEQLFSHINDHIRIFERKGTSLDQASALNLKAMIHFLLIAFDTPEIQRFWSMAGFSSMKQGAELALGCFEQAFNLQDQLEQEVKDINNADSRSEALAASQAYFTGALMQLFLSVAVELAFGLQDKNLTWKWIQRSKARGISKMLRISTPEEKLPFSPEPPVAGYSITFEDLQFVQTASATKLIFVDWIVIGSSPSKLIFFSFCMGTDEEGPIAVREMFEIEPSFEELEEAAGSINERRMNDDDAERYLRPFIPVIQPLENCSNEGEILILSPTAPLHHVPLHAVPLNNRPLIERNPVLYVSSHAALVNCLQRLAAPEPGAAVSSEWKAAIFGAYDDISSKPDIVVERDEIYRSLKALGTDFGCTPVLGNDLTEDSFKQESEYAKLIHIHSHGISDPHSPSNQAVILGSSSEPLTTSSLAALNFNAAHVTLIACSGGTQDFSLSGDEPLGLLSSFLLGGATSVIGALWPIKSFTGRLFTQVFYDYFLRYAHSTEEGPIVNLAKALQHTVLKIRNSKDTAAPYHWAPFILYGVWFCGRKPGTW